MAETVIDDDDINREDTRKQYIQYDTFTKWKQSRQGIQYSHVARMWNGDGMWQEDGEGTQV